MTLRTAARQSVLHEYDFVPSVLITVTSGDSPKSFYPFRPDHGEVRRVERHVQYESKRAAVIETWQVDYMS